MLRASPLQQTACPTRLQWAKPPLFPKRCSLRALEDRCVSHDFEGCHQGFTPLGFEATHMLEHPVLPIWNMGRKPEGTAPARLTRTGGCTPCEPFFSGGQCRRSHPVPVDALLNFECFPEKRFFTAKVFHSGQHRLTRLEPLLV